MSVKVIDASSLSPTELERTLGMPSEGPKCVPINLDFSQFPTFTLDYSNMSQRGFLSMVQTLYVNNKANANNTLDIFIPATQQTINVPAGVQGYFTVLCPTPIKMQFSSGGTGLAQVILCNFPILG